MSLDSNPRDVVLADGRQSPAARAVARGTARLLRSLGFCCISEMPLASGRRADLVALGPDGEFWIVEIKSSAADLRADRKWPEYRWHCDRLYFATALDVPQAIFPVEAGLIVADEYGGQIVREGEERRLAAATRRSMMLRFARLAALRLHGLVDPGAVFGPEL